MPVFRLGSSLRCRTLEETLRAAEPLMSTLGVSRVTDISRMDRLGLPVYASIRPRGQALRVHAGKGIEPLAAKVGALMEAIEFAVAEPARTQWTAQPMAIGRFLSQFEGAADLVDFAPVLGTSTTFDDVLVTVRCEDVRRAAGVQLPAELVFMPFDSPGGPPLFGWSSNGLASGNSLEEATLHALLEVLERDVVSMNRANDQSRWLEHDGLPAPFDRLLLDWREMGIETAVRWLPNPFGVTCFQACIHEPARASVHMTAGSGAHLDPEIALSRAICEAAQSRLSHVHGGRDDIVHFYSQYEGVNDADRAEKDRPTRDRLFDSRPSMTFADVPREVPSTDGELPGMLAGLLDALAAAGFDRIYRHRFAMDLGGLEVVKIVVPGCEDAENNPNRMGRRLFRAVTGEALQ